MERGVKPDLYRPSRLAMLASRMKRLREEADAFLDAIGHRPGSRGEQSHRRPSRRTRSSGSTFSPVPAISRQWSDRPSKHTHASAEWKKKKVTAIFTISSVISRHANHDPEQVDQDNVCDCETAVRSIQNGKNWIHTIKRIHL